MKFQQVVLQAETADKLYGSMLSGIKPTLWQYLKKKAKKYERSNKERLHVSTFHFIHGGGI